MKYLYTMEDIKKFELRTGMCKSTLYRFYKRNPELWVETKMDKNKRMFPIEHAKYFNVELLYEEHKTLLKERNSLKRQLEKLWIK